MSNPNAKINKEVLISKEDHAQKFEASFNQSKENKLQIAGSSNPYIPNLNKVPSLDSEGEDEEKVLIMTDLKAQGKNKCDHKLLYEGMVEIFARGSCIEYWKLQFLSKQFSKLLKSGEIFRARQVRGLVKPYVFMLVNGYWKMFDQDFKNFQKIQKIPSDFRFFQSDKETICAGTQLIVVGKEAKSDVVWRYELEMCKWFKGPSMITPRSMLCSASRGNEAFFAGGIKTSDDMISEVVNVAEKYNADTKTWISICGMHKRRKLSAGCFFRGKFHVIGGRDENEKYLTCGESYDEVTNSWELIPDMIEGMSISMSPPLVAVVNENLYMLDTVSNELHVYDITTNVWKKLGGLPVITTLFGGHGIIFKSIGDKLLVIGGLQVGNMAGTMSVFTCCATNINEIIWEKVDDSRSGVRLNNYVQNCCVMFA